MLDAQRPPPADGERMIDETVRAMRAGRVHLAGHLVGPAGIRYIVADRGDAGAYAAVSRQRDIVLDQQIGNAAVFRNTQWLPRASLATAEVTASAAAAGDLSVQMQATWAPGPALPARSQASFEGPIPGKPPPASALLGDNYNRGWKATVGRRSLEQEKAFGWANRFVLPANAAGTVRIRFSGGRLHLAGLVIQFLALTMAFAVARGPRRGEAKAPA